MYDVAGIPVTPHLMDHIHPRLLTLQQFHKFDPFIHPESAILHHFFFEGPGMLLAFLLNIHHWSCHICIYLSVNV
jgi:hypothetical protein